MRPSDDVTEIIKNHQAYRKGTGRLAERDAFLALLDYVRGELTPPYLDADAVLERLEKARSEGPGRGDVYVNYKSLTTAKAPKHAYLVLHVGLLAGGCEPVVVYQDLQDPRLVWVRDLREWSEEVPTEGGSTFRFHQLGSLAPLVEV